MERLSTKDCKLLKSYPAHLHTLLPRLIKIKCCIFYFGVYNSGVANTYIKCPVCDLNYALKKDKVCTVCKAKQKSIVGGKKDDENAGLCPICKINYITEDENVCTTCMSETDLTEDEIDKLYGGQELVSEEETDEDSDEGDIDMLSMQIEGDDDEDDEEDDEEDASDPLDDFDDTIDEDDDEDDEEF